MLFVKPLILAMKHRNDPPKQPEIKKALLSDVEPVVDTEENKPQEQAKLLAPVPPPPSSGHGHGDDDFDLSEIFVHQIIETIEFVLGELLRAIFFLKFLVSLKGRSRILRHICVSGL